MATGIFSQIQFQGDNKLVIKLTSFGGGAETNAVKVDVSTLTPRNYPTPGTEACTRVNLMRIDWTVSGQRISLDWDGTTKSSLLIFGLGSLDKSENGSFDFRRFGGLKNDATNPTGDILLTTGGNNAASSYSIIMELKKKYN